MSVHPSEAAAHQPDLLGRLAALLDAGRPVEVLQWLDNLPPDATGTPALLCLRARALQALGRIAEAMNAYGRALAQDGGHLDSLLHGGALLQSLGRAAEALACFERALQVDPDLDAADQARCAALLQMRSYAAAAVALRARVQRRPTDAPAWNNLGLACKGLADGPAAVAAFEQALALAPQFDLPHANLGTTLQQLGRHREARAHYLQALALAPHNPTTRWNLGLCRLLLGEWPEGGADYEARWQTGLALFAPRPFAEHARWRGGDVRGRTVLLHAEQGLGDTLQFCRYARSLAERGARVILEVPEPLQALLRRALGPGITVLARDTPLPAFDLHCPLLSVPWALGTTPTTVQARAPYLHADPERVALWQARLGDAGKPRIALVWSSGASNPARDIPLAQLPAIDGGHHEFIGLQPELAAADRAALADWPALRWLGDAVHDWDDSAAILSLCDAVVSVDTAAAHLAGALGRPLHLLLPFVPDWRWLLDRPDTPWYPGARLYRQDAPGSWEAAVAALKRALPGAHPGPGFST